MLLQQTAGPESPQVRFGGGGAAEKGGLDTLESGAVCGGDLKPRGFHSPGGSLEEVEGAGALGKEVSDGKTDERKERGACSLLLG